MVSLFKFWSAWFWLHIKVLMFRSNLPPQRRYPMARLHGVETQKTTFSVLIIKVNEKGKSVPLQARGAQRVPGC